MVVSLWRDVIGDTMEVPKRTLTRRVKTPNLQGTENRIAMLFPSVFWDRKVHFLRPVGGDYTFANNHALGVSNVLCAWIRPSAVDKVRILHPKP